jgi:hypothetical protein
MKGTEMNTDIVIYLATLFGLFMGWLPAAIAYRRKTVKNNKAHKAELAETFKYAFDGGWDAALMNPNEVKKAYQFYFVAK